jgi:Spy/CpxP family protein refolding chaperone
VQSIRSWIAAGSLLVGVAAIAPAQQTTPAPTPAGVHARKFGGPGRHKKDVDRALLRGITLSDAERANVRAVHTKYASQEQALRTQTRTESQDARAAQQRGDTAALRSLRANMTAQRQALMQSERNDVRNALTPANQAKFDANVQAMQARGMRRPYRPHKVTNR